MKAARWLVPSPICRGSSKSSKKRAQKTPPRSRLTLPPPTPTCIWTSSHGPWTRNFPAKASSGRLPGSRGLRRPFRRLSASITNRISGIPRTKRVINMNGASLTDAQVQAIVQSPRSLWDSTFKENSWITNSVLGGPIYILKRLQAKIDAANPGMKIAITEYENGGFNHIAGTIAQADNLGVFGSEGVFAANFWPPGGTYSYALAGFRAFRGFDGASANFGDTSLQTTSSSVKDVVVYASSDSATPGRFVFVAINRSNATKVTAIDGQSLNGTAHLYQMTSASGAGQTVVQPVSIGTMPVSGSSLTITLPAYSVTTIDAR